MSVRISQEPLQLVCANAYPIEYEFFRGWLLWFQADFVLALLDRNDLKQDWV